MQVLEASSESSEDLLPIQQQTSRREALQTSIMTATFALGWTSFASPSFASSTSESAEVTDKIYINIKGFPAASTDQPATADQRIVIGLFGKDAPTSTLKLKQLVSAAGLPSQCSPITERTLQKEQLEANKVYRKCMDGIDDGVPLSYSTVWRIIKDERIDLGAVKGKFVAREYPEWKETTESALRHDAPGIVSVRRGNEGGFGFTIYPGNGNSVNTQQLDEDHIVVGRVLEGMDIVEALNKIPVVVSSGLNYMSLTGGPKTNNAPDRSCRYGGPMYCNENKPLIKLSITDVGVL